jgi:acylphosphatase
MFRHYLISGRVQGVGYRAFAQRSGVNCGLRGWVRNLRDGRVEALVEGTNEKLAEFEVALNRGPAHALVERVQSKIVDGSFVWENFSVAPNGDGEWSQDS